MLQPDQQDDLLPLCFRQVREIVNNSKDADDDQQEQIEGPMVVNVDGKLQVKPDDKPDFTSMTCEYEDQIHLAWCDRQMFDHVNSCIICHSKLEKVSGYDR